MDQTFGQWVQEVIDREYGGVAGRLAEAIGDWPVSIPRVSVVSVTRVIYLGIRRQDRYATLRNCPDSWRKLPKKVARPT